MISLLRAKTSFIYGPFALCAFLTGCAQPELSHRTLNFITESQNRQKSEEGRVPASAPDPFGPEPGALLSKSACHGSERSCEVPEDVLGLIDNEKQLFIAASDERVRLVQDNVLEAREAQSAIGELGRKALAKRPQSRFGAFYLQSAAEIRQHLEKKVEPVLNRELPLLRKDSPVLERLDEFRKEMELWESRVAAESDPAKREALKQERNLDFQRNLSTLAHSLDGAQSILTLFGGERLKDHFQFDITSFTDQKGCGSLAYWMIRAGSRDRLPSKPGEPLQMLGDHGLLLRALDGADGSALKITCERISLPFIPPHLEYDPSSRTFRDYYRHHGAGFLGMGAPFDDSGAQWDGGWENVIRKQFGSTP